MWILPHLDRLLETPDGDRVAYAASQDVGARYPQIPPEAFSKSVQLVRPDGSFVSGARAVFETLGWNLPALVPAADVAYGVIARHRGFIYWVTRLCFGKTVEPARFQVTQWLFLKALAVVYLIAFASLGVQVMGLLGADGIAPARAFLGQVGAGLGAARYFAVPQHRLLPAPNVEADGAECPSFETWSGCPGRAASESSHVGLARDAGDDVLHGRVERRRAGRCGRCSRSARSRPEAV